MTLKKSTVYTTTDGATHPDHKAAKLHEDNITRKSRVEALLGDLGANTEGLDNPGLVDADFIARNGLKFIAALTVPSGRAPRTPKAVA